MRKDDLPKRQEIVKFEHVGDKVAGEVLSVEFANDKFNEGERVLVLELDTTDGPVQCYARRRQQEAIREALDVADVDDILVGGWLELVYAGDFEVSGAANAAKRWEAVYEPPAESTPGWLEQEDEERDVG
jgi:hypothetical protein